MKSIRAMKWKVAAVLVAACLVTQPAWAKILSIPFFSQLDPRWSNSTICATVSMAMALAYRGAPVDPPKLIAWLQHNNGYTWDITSPVNWEVATHYQGKHWLQYNGVSTLGSPQQIAKDIDSGKIIISMSKRFWIHWVIIRGVSSDGKAYYWDPWDKTPTQRVVGDGWVNPGISTRVFTVIP
ncbi:MAG TPA: C39 family peptidase [Planctomycetaceae bacterium]|nr:C39 family peptidase [Planctomycetaceae bacterium]